MKTFKKALAAVVAVAVVGAIAAGCSNGNNGDNKTTSPAGSNAGSANISGVITMSGSTSMEKMCNAMNQAFNRKYPNAKGDAQFTGSGAGIKAVSDGTANIGNSSRALKDAEKAQGLVENIVATDGIAVVTDTANTVANLTMDQLKKIYTGEITNWKDVGGSDQKIVVIGRENGSGTRDGFESILGIAEKCKYSQEIDSTGAVMGKVKATKGAIGYVSLDVVDNTVKALTLEGVAATAPTIQDGTYKLQRPFVMATKGPIESQSEVIKAYFAFIKSEEGQKIIDKVGLIRLK